MTIYGTITNLVFPQSSLNATNSARKMSIPEYIVGDSTKQVRGITVQHKKIYIYSTQAM